MGFLNWERQQFLQNPEWWEESEKLQDNNDLSIGMVMLNTEKDVKTKDTATKKVLEVACKARKKTDKDTEEVSKRNELHF